ncbi:uncharacterized protein LOC104851699 [Fukomys damarensis]|uniref:uncharacterized protein LOC104851699 n=1 Tax=Fukomys damarensis TaxID=885580 RepID=UPI00053FF60D|nr:uncharacterized protein LOC104851699 [Fukomys damarensis]
MSIRALRTDGPFIFYLGKPRTHGSRAGFAAAVDKKETCAVPVLHGWAQPESPKAFFPRGQTPGPSVTTDPPRGPCCPSDIVTEGSGATLRPRAHIPGNSRPRGSWDTVGWTLPWGPLSSGKGSAMCLCCGWPTRNSRITTRPEIHEDERKERGLRVGGGTAPSAAPSPRTEVTPAGVCRNEADPRQQPPDPEIQPPRGPVCCDQNLTAPRLHDRACVSAFVSRRDGPGRTAAASVRPLGSCIMVLCVVTVEPPEQGRSVEAGANPSSDLSWRPGLTRPHCRRDREGCGAVGRKGVFMLRGGPGPGLPTASSPAC